MNPGAQSFQRAISAALVMRAIRSEPEISRTGIAERTGLTKSTVGNVTRELKRRDLIVEEESGERQGAGRPRVGLAINESGPVIVGIDLRPDRLAVVECSLSGRVISQHTTEHAGSSIAEQWRSARSLVGSNRLLAIGLSLPATVDPYRSVVLRSNSFGLTEGEVTLAEAGIEDAVPILVENDANAVAWGAMDSLAESTTETTLAVVLRARGSVELGTGLVIDGRVHAGVGYEAGEFRPDDWLSIGSAGPTTPLATLRALFNALIPTIAVVRPGRVTFAGDLVGWEREIEGLLEAEFGGSLLDPSASGPIITFARQGRVASALGAASMVRSRLFEVPSADRVRVVGLPRWEELPELVPA